MTNRQIITSNYKPRPHALDFHARAQRFSVMVLHRRAGKTVMCVADLIDKAIQCKLPFPQYAYVAPFYSQAKSIAWNYLKQIGGELVEKTMESELSVVLKNGAKIRLFGADNIDALRGNYFDGLVIDEYAQIHPRLFGEVLAPALADRKGWAVFIGTPFGQNHFFELWQNALNNPNWFTRMLRASESGIIDAEELELLRTNPGSDQATYDQEMECSFTAANRGAFYGEMLLKLEQAGHMRSIPYDPEKRVLLSFDIGYSDSTSIWFFQTNGKELAIIDFWSESGYSVADVLAMLRDKSYQYGTFFLPHDARNKSFQTGKSVRELMQADGCQTSIVASLSVQDGIQAVRATLPNCYFNTDSKDVRDGLNALRMYQREWDPKKLVFKVQPLHNWASDPADSFRMLALAMNPAAVKEANRTINHTSLPTNVVTLDRLFAEREARQSDVRRI